MPFHNLGRMTTATTGTGSTLTLGSAVANFNTFANAGVADGEVVSYCIIDGTGTEDCTGTYTASGTTLTRTTVSSTNGGSPLNLSGSATVTLTALAQDLAVFRYYAGNPNGHVIGYAAGYATNSNPTYCLDTTTGVLWYCTTSGPAATAVWSPASSLVYTTITRNTSATQGYGYVVSGAQTVGLTCPTPAVSPQPFEVVALGAGGFEITPLAGHTIHDANSGLTITSTQALAGAQGTSAKLKATSTTTWEVIGGRGTLSATLSVDPFWNNVSVYLPLTSATVPAAEASNNALAITNTGTVVGTTAQTKYGAPYSASFDGATQSLSLPAGNEAYKVNGPFTVDGWFNQNNRTGQQTLWDTRSGAASTTGLQVYTATTTGNLVLWVNNAALITTSTPIPASSWNHVAASYDALAGTNGTWTLWLNGANIGSASSALMLTDGNFVLGANVSAANFFNGDACYQRITQGVCRYASAFTTPANACSTVPETTSDPLWGNVCYMPRATAGNTGTDVSGNALALTLTSMTTAASSMQDSYEWVFNGTTGFIQAGTPGDASKLYGDFTLEANVNLTAGSDQCIFDTRSTAASATGLLVYYQTSSQSLIVFTNNAALITASTTITAGAKHHVAVTRRGKTITLWQDGASVGVSTATVARFSDGALYIGRYATSSAGFFNGAIDGIRLTRGPARYSAPFPVPATPFPVAAPTTYDPTWAATTFMPRAAAGNTQTDASGNALPITNNGSVTTGNSGPEQDAYYWTFDGSTQYLTLTTQGVDAMKFAAEWCYDTWIYPTRRDGTHHEMFFCTASSGATFNNAWEISLTNTNGFIELYVTQSSAALVTAVAPTLNQWNHVALVRYGNEIIIYLNGVFAGSVTATTNYTAGCATVARDALTSNNSYFAGRQSATRVKKTPVRTANFTPPTSPYLTNGVF